MKGDYLNAEKALEKDKKNGFKNKIRNFMFSKKFKYDGLFTVLVLIFVLAVFLVNVIVSNLVERFDVKIDLSLNGIYKVSRETKDFLDEYEKDVDLILLNNEENFKTGDVYLSHIYNITKNFAASSPHLSLKFVNLHEQPNFVAGYSDLNLQQDGLLIDGGKNGRRFLSIYDMFQKQLDSENGNNVVQIVSSVEKSIAYALESLTGDRRIDVYSIKGHEEINLKEDSDVFLKNGYNILDLDISNKEIGKEVEVIFIVSPCVDYSEEEISRLENFVKNGKKLVYFASASQPPLPKLEKFLQENFGVTYKEGVVVETDASKMSSSSANDMFLFAENENGYTKNISNKKLPIKVEDCKPSVVKESGKDLQITKICETSATSIVFLDKEDFDVRSAERRPFAFAVGVNKNVGKGKVCRAVLFSSVYFLGSINIPQFGNGELFISALDEMIGWNRKVKVFPKVISVPSLAISKGIASFLGLFFIFVLPIFVAVFAILIYFVRRRR